MASKRRQRRKACDGKKRYPTHDEALHDAMYLQRRDGFHMRAYRCQFCGAHHVGHMPRKNVRAMMKSRDARG
ncbi:MAG: hypothetical protein CVU73_10915 [Deltaproteobacteria bacterium HGW-Deltaproteobacteria-8]|nr:MAG: hypothetical protein CVU73_10915 [Deltaproteobacteria bacterium HGW-Deltaproteobacteria-8]